LKKTTLSILAGVLLALPAASQVQLAKLLDPYARRYDQLGTAVALDGNLVLVGAPGADYLRRGFYDQTFTFYWTDWKHDAGAAYLFDRTTGNLLHLFRPTYPRRHGVMGSAVALDGTIAVVGAPHALNSGVAHVYDTTTGQKMFELKSPLGGWGFGYAIAIDTLRIAVGGPWINGEGLVAVFDRITGALLYTIVSPVQTGTPLHFGRSIALDAGRLLVGAPGNYKPGHVGGRAYLFDALTGSLLREYEASDTNYTLYFGKKVDLEGDRVLVAAPEANFNGNGTGAAYLFDASTGTQLAKFLSNNPGVYDRFGSAAIIEQGRILLGARGEDGSSPGSGIVYVYAALDGAPLGTFVPADTQPGDQFGSGLAGQGDVVVVGAWYASDTVQSGGAAYVFDVSAY